ncbi:MAG: TlpA disulfide reductase family protein [Geobacteraceae bacterium]|nr:TlpA disulfide reductase family protein [Geobacteraceae bacterium]
MKKLCHATLALVLAFSYCFLSGCGKPDNVSETGHTAPDFTLRDMSGNRVRLADLRGSVVLINFWATWCPPCREEAPSLARLNSRMTGRAFRLLAVAVDEGGAVTVERFFRQFGIRLPALLDPSGNVARLYGIRGIPETFVIDRQGVVRKKVVGPITWDDPAMVSYLEELVKR